MYRCDHYGSNAPVLRTHGSKTGRESELTVGADKYKIEQRTWKLACTLILSACQLGIQEEEYMEMVTLGKTGITVNKNGFGALPIQRIGTKDAVKLARKAYDAGITFFDTARF